MRPHTNFARLHALWLLVSLVLSVASTSGCRSNDGSLNGTIYIYLVLTETETLNEKVLANKRARADFFLQAFRREHPGVNIQLQYYLASELEEKLRRRIGDGHAPDLLLLNAETAQYLNRSGLTRRVQLSAQVFVPESVAPLQASDGLYVGVPFAYEPQLACFNNSLIERAPRSLEELLELSDHSQVGLHLSLVSLYWTLGALGAEEAYAHAIDTKQVAPSLRGHLTKWLQWLQHSNEHVGMYYYVLAHRMFTDFTEGKLALVSCRSPFIRQFKQALGERFSVSLLPHGPGGSPSPVSLERVWAFGTQSTEQQKKIAAAVVAFAANPVVQFRTSLESDELLPTNKNVTIPLNTSPFLEPLVRSHQLAPELTHRTLLYLGNRSLQARSNQILAGLLYGDLTPEAAAEALIHLLETAARASRSKP